MKIAAFTISRNEKYFLPIWYRYYSSLFSESNVFVIDHESNDGSTNGIKNNIIVSNPNSWDIRWVAQKVNNFQRKLLTSSYDVVLYCDTDEIICPDNRHFDGNLVDYINEMEDDYMKCRGLEVLHGDEPDLNFDGKILEQRKYFSINSRYFKTPISKVPLFYSGGFHRVRKSQSNPWIVSKADERLLLFHLKWIDRSTLLKRNIERINDKPGVGMWFKRTYKINENELLDACNENLKNKIEIPIDWKALF